MSNLTIIIPVHKMDDTYAVLFNHAIDSVAAMNYDANVMVIGPKEVLSDARKAVVNGIVPVQYVENEASDYCNQVNEAARKVTTPYFSVLEIDDEFTPIWMNNVEKYMADKKDVSMFLPLTQVYDYSKQEKNLIGYLNEVAWALGFSDDIGYLSNEALLAYSDYNISGAIINTDDFKTAGMLKPSIKIFFWYEFMLRLTNKGKKIYVVPKVGYKHFANRPDSLMSEYQKDIEPEEAQWWLETAKSESYFDRDRQKVYVKEEK